MKIAMYIFLCSISLMKISYSQSFIPPPGTIKVNDSIFIDEILITNEDWKEYIYYNKIENDFYYYPDTSIYIDNKNYFFDNKYDEYPVLCSDEIAIKHYCDWRSSFVNSLLKTYTSESKCQSAFYVENSNKNLKITYKKAKIEDLIKCQNYIKISFLSEKKIRNIDLSNSFRCVADVKELR